MSYHCQEHLPIYQLKEAIVESIRSNQVTVVAGETGSGKTTHLPLFCLEAGRGGMGRIGCTQPRRIAAVSLARYVSTLFSDPGQVGYKIRFREDLTSDAKIKFMTDGILLAEIAGDPLLRQYDTLIIDEAHERSINVDFLLGFMRRILPQRPDLHLVISSATIDTRLFSRAFHNAPVITVPGRLFPVEIRYKPVIELWKGESMDSYVEGVVSSVQEIIDTGETGDILAFLPTIDDVTETVNRIRQVTGDSCDVLPLHSRISPELQQKIFKSSKSRKIIAATNIAETSITVPGIRFVIDTGLARLLRYEPMAGFSRMPVERVSKASADQRAGRCGRVQDGICIRLYSEQDYLSRPAFTTPELRRANLSGVILKMLALRFYDASRFPFLQHPSLKAIHDGYQQLRDLGAIDKKNSLTSLGKKMALLPVDPRLSRMLLYATKHGAAKEILIIASALSVEDPLCGVNGQARIFRNPESDFLSYLNLWSELQRRIRGQKLSSSLLKKFCSDYNLMPLRIREWYDAHRQLERLCRSIHGFLNQPDRKASSEAIHKSLLAGLKDGIAFRVDKGLYHGISGEIRVFPSSALFRKNHQWILFAEIVETSRVYGRIAAVIRPGWIEDIFRDQCYYSNHDPWFDPESGTVKAYQEVTYKGLSLVRNRIVDLSSVDKKLAVEIFIKEALVKEKAGLKYRFLQRNHDLLREINTVERKLRKRLIHDESDRESFYEERLPDVSTLQELNREIRRHGSDSFLIFKPADLSLDEIPDLSEKYPDQLILCGEIIPVTYLYCPGEENDGASVVISEEIYRSVPLYYWEWLLPSFLEERVEIVLDLIREKLESRSILRRDAKRVLMEKLSVADDPFLNAVCMYVRELFSIQISPEQVLKHIPENLWISVTVKGCNSVIKTRFRLPLSKPSVEHPGCRKRSRIWGPLCSELERDFSEVWNQPFLLKPVPVKPSGNLVPVRMIPALCREDHSVSVKAFFSPYFARSAHSEALAHLLETKLVEKLAWELESFRLPLQLVYAYKNLCSREELHDTACRIFTGKVLSLPVSLPDSRSAFQILYQEAENRISDAGQKTIELLDRIISELNACSALLIRRERKYGKILSGEEFKEAVNNYIGILFSDAVPAGFIERLPAYISGLGDRINTAFFEPARYRDVSQKIKSFSLKIEKLIANPNLTSYERLSAWELRILLEELILFYFSGNSPKNRICEKEQILHEKLGQWSSATFNF